MIMTPEEIFNQQVWIVLQKIKEEFLATKSGTPVVISHLKIGDLGKVPRDRWEKILKKLEEWSALKVREDPFEPPVSTHEEIYLDIHHNTFETVYSKYQKACDLNSYLNEYQKQIHTGVESPSEFLEISTSNSSTMLLIERISSIYERVKSTNNPSIFFKNLFEYVDEYFREDLLPIVIRAINELGDTETAELKQLEKQAYAEIDQSFQKLLAYCEKVGVKNSMITEAMKDYRSYERGTIESSEGNLAGRMGEVEDILRGLVYTKQPEHLKFVKKFAEFSHDKQHLRKYTFSPSFDKHKQEKQNLDRLRETRVWFSWDKLYTFHNLYTDHNSVYQHYMKSGKPMTALSAGMLADELNIILSQPTDPNRYIREFKVETYKNYLDRVHLFAKELLHKFDEHERSQVVKSEQTKPRINSKSDEKISWYFDSSTNTLYIAQRKLQLRTDSLRSQLLGYLAKNNKHRTAEHFYTELYTEINGSDPENIQKAKRKFYDASQGIIAHIAKKTGKQQFLICNSRSVKVNPIYSFQKP